MHYLKSPSIARRIFATLAIIIACIWLFVIGQSMYVNFKERTGPFDQGVKSAAVSLSKVIDKQTSEEQVALVASIVDQYSEIDSVGSLEQIHDVRVGEIYVGQIWHNKTLIYRTKNAPLTPISDKAEAHFDNLLDGKKVRGYSALSADKTYRVDLALFQDFRRDILVAALVDMETLFTFSIITLLILIPLWFAVLGSLKPLNNLALELSQRKPGDLGPIQSPHVYIELAPLINELNGAMQRIKQLRTREQEFLADAAHELRTPLAVITAQADDLINSQDIDQRRESGKSLRQGITRASRVIHQLLVLARLDAHSTTSVSTVDVADIVRDTLALLSIIAQERDIELSYVGPDSLMLPMPAHALNTVLENLIMNSIKYGIEHGKTTVTIAVMQTNQIRRISLTVADDGLGIDPSEYEHIFERFRRGKDMQQTGAGLGLPIVVAAAKQFGATVCIEPGIEGLGVGFNLAWSVDVER